MNTSKIRVLRTLPLTWRRFEAYEVKDKIIRPKPGAGFTDYDLAEAVRETGEPGELYLSLLKLVREIGITERGPLRQVPTDKHYPVILEWCSQHGMLGLLHQETEAIALPVRDAVGASGDVLTYQVRYSRMPKGWVETLGGYVDRDSDDGTAEEIEPDPEKDPLGTDYREYLDEPLAIRRDADGHVRAVRAHDAWSRYFADVDADSHLPMPGSDRFWVNYGEPVGEFLVAIGMLDRFLQGLQDGRLDSVGEQAVTGVFPTIWPVPEPRCGEPPTVWHAPASLLGMLVLRAMDEASKGYKIAQCADAKTCSNLFMTTRDDALYCSERCAKRVRARRFRLAQREKAEKAKRRKRGKRPTLSTSS